MCSSVASVHSKLIGFSNCPPPFDETLPTAAKMAERRNSVHLPHSVRGGSATWAPAGRGRLPCASSTGGRRDQKAEGGSMASPAVPTSSSGSGGDGLPERLGGGGGPARRPPPMRQDPAHHPRVL